jgi:galactosyl transferase GMA12/MNN10 family
MKLFIDLWSDSLIVDRTPPWSQREQDALTYLIVHHPFLRERIGFVRQRLINAYVMGLHMWVKGEFLVHFAGCWYEHGSSDTDSQG